MAKTHRRGCALTAKAGAFSERDFSTSAALEEKSVEVTDAVQYDLATCRPTTLFVLEFAPENTSPTPDSRASFYGYEADPVEKRPELEVRYRAE